MMYNINNLTTRHLVRLKTGILCCLGDIGDWELGLFTPEGYKNGKEDLRLRCNYTHDLKLNKQKFINHNGNLDIVEVYEFPNTVEAIKQFLIEGFEDG